MTVLTPDISLPGSPSVIFPATRDAGTEQHCEIRRLSCQGVTTAGNTGRRTCQQRGAGRRPWRCVDAVTGGWRAAARRALDGGSCLALSPYPIVWTALPLVLAPPAFAYTTPCLYRRRSVLPHAVLAACYGRCHSAAGKDSHSAHISFPALPRLLPLPAPACLPPAAAPSPRR